MSHDDDVTADHHWRHLYEDLLAVGRDEARPLLEHWLARRPRHVAEVREAGEAGSHLRRLNPPSRDAYTTSERLYALSRVVDLLLLAHQERPDEPGPVAGRDPGYPSHDAYPALCAALSAEPIGPRPFHPFFHEVVEVQQAADPDERPSVVVEVWPGHLVGSMLLVRSGVVVRAGSRWLVRGVADRSVLYWTFRRRHRRTDDLSHGWGSNSQWGTDFRRDYVVDGALHYDVDAALAEPRRRRRPPDDELDPAASTQLLRYRCSTVVDHGADLFPYGAHHVEPVTSGP